MNNFDGVEDVGIDPMSNVSGQPDFLSPMYNHAGTIIAMTNPENELYELELSLRNVIKDSDGKLISVGKPLMNEYGIRSMLQLVQGLVTRITIMSNFQENHISNLMDFLGDTIAKNLMLNRITYEIYNPESTRDLIFYAILSTTFSTLRRGFEEGDKRFWKGSQQEITTRIEGGGGNRKSGLIGKVMGWGK